MTTAILVRAALVALILGSVLTLANQWDAVVWGAEFDLLPLVLVYVTPFVVVAISQVLGIRRALADARRGPGPLRERFLATAVSHGIPGRAVLTGLLIGGADTSIVVAVALAQSGGLTAVPVALLGQAFTLPILFGLLSQSIAYRRAYARAAA